MPGQIVSVPFISQIEDMEKYLAEYRLLKLMPQNQQQFRQQGHTGSQGVNGQQHKRVINGAGASIGQYFGSVNDSVSGVSSGKRAQLGNMQVKYSGQHLTSLLPSSASLSSFQKDYSHMVYNRAEKVGSNQSSISLPLPGSQKGNTSSQQGFMKSSSSSESVSPSRLQSTITGNSTVNSLSSEYGDNVATGDFYNHCDSMGFAQATSSTSAVNNFNINPPFVQTNSSSASIISASNYFTQGLPSSLLVDSAVTGTRPIDTSMFSADQFTSPSNFPMSRTTSSTWGGASSDFAVTTSAVNQSKPSSTSLGTFGIWNNDMGVWG